MVRYAARLTGSVCDGEEAVQEAFLQLFDELCAGTNIDNPRAWTFCVVKRGASRKIEHHLKREVPLEDAALFAAPALPGTEDADLHRMLSALTPREVEVVMLRLESMKYREIATVLGITSGSVNVLLARALRKLQGLMVPAKARNLVKTLEAHEIKTLQ
jgi:RNA polymerase sigma-70 factor (ECF subfamily)